MEITPHQLEYLEYINKHGIEFAATHWSIGTFPLAANQIQTFINDPDQFIAESFNVSKEKLLKWNEFMGSLQCHGQTKKGKPCRNLANNGYNVDKPNLYELSNTDLYCGQHIEQAHLVHSQT